MACVSALETQCKYKENIKIMQLPRDPNPFKVLSLNNTRITSCCCPTAHGCWLLEADFLSKKGPLPCLSCTSVQAAKELLFSSKPVQGLYYIWVGRATNLSRSTKAVPVVNNINSMKYYYEIFMLISPRTAHLQLPLMHNPNEFLRFKNLSFGVGGGEGLISQFFQRDFQSYLQLGKVNTHIP